MENDYDEAREEFESVLNCRMEFRDGGVFMDVSTLGNTSIDELISKHGVVEAQWQVNHVHMWCHSDSLDVQRKLALEAIDVLSKRIKAEYRDDVILKSEISEDTYEVMFALWIEEAG